jgi:hypothetical protein
MVDVRAFGNRLRRAALLVPAIAGLALAASCASDTVREGRGGSYVIIDALEGASGAKGGQEFSGIVDSDVLTYVKKMIGGQEVYIPTIFEDPARVRMRLALKDVGSVTNPNSPTTNNQITITRYRVVYRRADGRNTPGVDVPYAFDGGVTFTVGAQPVTAAFPLVRIQAKNEAPLIALRDGGFAYAISTIAEITFYGTDQVGNEVSVTGLLSVNFADWGDPD